jgi:pyruvate kinase
LFAKLLENNYAREGDLLIFTKGEMTGVSGGTNSMTILRVAGNQ